jgi:tetratricopeptide (TPR) repeat protein
MKTKSLLLILFLLVSRTYGQEIQELFDNAIKAYQERKYDEAVNLIDKCLAKEPGSAILWYNRGVFHSAQGAFKESIEDFTQSIIFDPTFKKSYNARGNSRQDVQDYQGAIYDYKVALKFDTAYIDALWNMAETWEKLSDTTTAAFFYQKAANLGDDLSLERLNYYRVNKKLNDTLLNITGYTTDSSYGFRPANPVYVGYNLYTLPQSERYYLDQLYDAQGNRVVYERIGSCCQYPSKNGILGYALLDKYMITYSDENNLQVKRILYISSYDNNNPLVPLGLYLKK